jgi:hypothetical protein
MECRAAFLPQGWQLTEMIQTLLQAGIKGRERNREIPLRISDCGMCGIFMPFMNCEIASLRSQRPLAGLFDEMKKAAPETRDCLNESP